MADESVSIRGVYNLTNPKRAQMLADGGVVPPGPGPAPAPPVFTTQPALTGSTALGSTITVSLGAASGIPAPTLTGTLTRPGKAAATVLDGATFQIEEADQGGTITLDVTATNSAGSAPPATAALAVPAAPPGPQPDPSPYQPDMTTGRIAPITTSFGGRPNVTPATYYFDGQDELASMSMGA